MKRPVVGMPTCLDDRGRWRAGRAYSYIDRAYADAIDAAGGLPLQLPLQREPAALVQRIDALLVPGGDDLLPHDEAEKRRYPASVHFDPAPQRQLAFDRELLAAALANGLPVLGICYGMQLMALGAGAGIDFDLPTDRPDASSHELSEAQGRHPVAIAPDSRLAALIGARECQVNSLHHQAVREPGRGFRAVAHSPDGVIEAIEADPAADATQPFALGVQWHPEKLEGPAGQPLIDAFVEAARAAAYRS